MVLQEQAGYVDCGRVLLGVAAMGVMLAGSGCRRTFVDLENRPCVDHECASGYACDPYTQVCRRPLPTDCAHGGLCPAAIETGDACAKPGDLLRCTESAAGCEAGCRKCLSDGTWSACRLPDCDLGTTSNCGWCGDDCHARVRHAFPACVSTADDFACTYSRCDRGFADADDQHANGCECPIDCGDRCAGDDGCGGTCVDRCVAPRYCGGAGGIANRCGWWWSCKYRERQPILVSAGSAAVPADYSVRITLDHTALHASNRSVASGDDVRVVYWNAVDRTWIELPRVVDPESAWNRTDTAIWFRLQAPLGANQATQDYFLYFDNPDTGSPPDDEAEVFHFADFFDNGDGESLPAPWNEHHATASGTPVTDLEVAGGSLHFATTAEAAMRPAASATFAPLTGKLVWRWRYDWTRQSTEEYYRVYMQLGSAAGSSWRPETSLGGLTGVGASIAWGRFTYNASAYHNRLGVQYVPGFYFSELVYSGSTPIVAVVDVPSQSFTVTVTGTAGTTVWKGADGEPLPAFLSTLASINAIRFMTDGVGDGFTDGEQHIVGRALEYVLLHPLVTPEPAVALGSIEGTHCP